MINKIIGIYKITSPSGKVYIGQSWDIKNRWNHYKYKNEISRQFPLTNSFIKYGYAAHKFEVIHELPSDVEQEVMNRYEQFYMDQYRECEIILLNCKEGGANGKLHPDAIERRSAKIRGQKRSDETKSKISFANTQRILSQETKDKIGAANKGNICSEETRDKLSQAGKGKKKPAHHGYNVSKALTGVPKSKEHRKALSEARIKSGCASGANNPKAKLTENIVREIRLKHKAGSTLSELFREYKMSKSGMHSILTGKNWSDVKV